MCCRVRTRATHENTAQRRGGNTHMRNISECTVSDEMHRAAYSDACTADAGNHVNVRELEPDTPVQERSLEQRAEAMPSV